MAVLRLVRPIDAIAVAQAGPRVGDVAVPDLIGVLGKREPVQLAPAALVEQAELDLFRVRGKEGEVNAFAVPGRAERTRLTRIDHGSPDSDHTGSSRTADCGGR